MKKEFCQSCGMPLTNAEDFGTEKDGSKSTEYCHFCYQNGTWTQPNITLEETIAKGHEAIDRMEINILFYAVKGHKIKRWKK